MPVYVLPNATAMTKNVAMLFGDDTKVAPGKPLMSPGSGNLIAIYIDDADKPVAAVLCDIPFAAYAGCAYRCCSPEPPRMRSRPAKKLEQTMLDNLYEVMNIVSTMLMDERTPHLKLGTLYPDLSKPPADAKALLRR